MKHTAWLTTVVVSLLLVSCTVPVRIRSLERPFPSAETSGRPYKVTLGGRIGARPTMEFSSDLRNTVPSTNLPKVEAVEDVAVFGEWAVRPNLDVGVDLNMYEFMLRGKYQFVGEPLQTTHAGNFSLAVSGGLGAGISGREGDSTAASTTPNSASYSAQTVAADAAVVAGIRVTDWLQPFAGISAKYLNFDASYTTNIAAIGNGSFKGDAFWWGPYFGLEFSRRRFRYRQTVGYTPFSTGNLRKNFFSSQGELSIALGSID